MSEILKVTQPLVRPDQSNLIKPQSPQTPGLNISGIVDPSKVVRPDGKNVPDNSTKQDGAHLASNFDSFFQALKNVPNLSETFTELLFSKLINVVNSGIDKGFAQEISQFMQLLKMTESELLTFVESQLQTSVKFGGPVFDALRQILSHTKNEDLKNSILEFIKIFDNASGANHTMKNIMANLEQILQKMPASKREKLQQMIGDLSTASSQGANTKNLEILKKNIIPFLSGYIGDTKDFGAIRDVIARLTLNIVSYENGTTEKLLNSLQRLLKDPTVAKQFADISAKEIEAILTNAKFKDANTRMIDSFLNVLSRGIKGDTGDPANKEFFEDILKSILLNKSVYMPLQHAIIPADINGNMFFSEMWIDPDANDNAKNGGDEPAAKLLIKFDIQNVGFFEMVILCQKSKIDMLFFYPQGFDGKSAEIKKAITHIMEKNGLSCGNIAVDRSVAPLVVSDVFPKIYERKDTINVKV